MAGVHIKLKIDDKDFQRALHKLDRLGRDKQELFDDIGEHLVNTTVDRFDDQQDPDGNAWEPLKASTVQRKQDKRKPTDILVQDMFLRDTIHYESTRDSLLVGSNLIYAATHQLGDDERNIPARAFLGISDSDKADIAQIINNHITKLIR